MKNYSNDQLAGFSDEELDTLHDNGDIDGIAVMQAKLLRTGILDDDASVRHRMKLREAAQTTGTP